MELTDELYGWVLRYVENEMNEQERRSFEALLLKNVELQDEVDLFTEIRSLSGSIDEKICAVGKETNDNEVFEMIKQARETWEKSEGENLVQGFHISGEEETHPDNEEQYYSTEIPGKPVATEPGNVRALEEKEGNVRKMYFYKWAAAAVIGFVAVSVALWYNNSQNSSPGLTNSNKKISVNKNEVNAQQPGKNSTVKEDEEQLIAKKPEAGKTTEPPSAQTSKSPSIANNSHANSPSNAKSADEVIKIGQTERDRLVAKNFQADDLPSDIPDPLEDASASYKRHKQNEAIDGYKKVLQDIKEAEKSDITTRGDEDMELTTFYAHYYLAQSFMSVNDAGNAIREFENAVLKAPDATWKSKAQWYLALAYLKVGEIKKSKALLKEVSDKSEANEYKRKALTLLVSLGNK